MGAILNTANLSITFKTDPHCSLDILPENGVSQEAYTMLEDTQLPAFTQTLVPVKTKAMGLSTEIKA